MRLCRARVMHRQSYLSDMVKVYNNCEEYEDQTTTCGIQMAQDRAVVCCD